MEVNYNTEKSGIEVKFDDKPSREILEQLKANRFRWSGHQKLWYAKDTKERREFLSSFLPESITVESRSVGYPEIDINDIESYTIPKELSERENSGHWVFRTHERDHQKELQEYLKNCNDEFIKMLENVSNKELIYKAKRYLQHYKKAYYKNYMSRLKMNADCPSWITTGRSGRNRRKDIQYQNRNDNLMRELCNLTDEYKEKLSSFKNKINCEENLKKINEYEEAIKDLDISKYKFKKIKVKINPGAVGNIFTNATIEANAYVYGDYFIIKDWGKFRAYNKAGNEIEQMGSGSLKDAKKYVIYILTSK